jgi:hypothetical protein
LTSYKNEFVGVASSLSIQKYLSTQEDEIKNNVLFKDINDDSNPILIKYRLKTLSAGNE